MRLSLRPAVPRRAGLGELKAVVVLSQCCDSLAAWSCNLVWTVVVVLSVVSVTSHIACRMCCLALSPIADRGVVYKTSTMGSCQDAVLVSDTAVRLYCLVAIHCWLCCLGTVVGLQVLVSGILEMASKLVMWGKRR